MQLISSMSFLLWFSTILVSCRGEETCPPPIEMAPCTCKNVAYGINVICSNITKKRNLSDTFRRLSQYHLDSLLLHRINITGTISQEIFRNMRVESLQIESSRLLFEGPAFSGLENSLAQLKIMKCSSMGTFELARLVKLRELYLNGDKRRRIANTWLEDKMPNLHILNLDRNEIDEVENRAFVHMKNLREISLASNRINTVYRSIFHEPALRLTRIDLSHNILRDLPMDMFKEMPSLEHVILSGNELTTLAPETWEEIWGQLRSVLLIENAIVCDSNMQWISEKTKPPLFEGLCVEPKAMEGKPIKEAFPTSF